MRLSDLKEEAYGPEDYEQIKAKQERERKDKQKKQDRVNREKGQLQRAQQKVQRDCELVCVFAYH